MNRIARRPHHKHPEPPDRSLFDKVGGRYRPLQEAGCGAVSLVHLARDERSGFEVALKRLRGDKLGNGNARLTLKTEAHALSFVHHPGIPAFYEAMLEGPDPYIVEEFKEGMAFSINHLNAGRKTVELTINICDMLHTLHRAGIVHRDVKPSNLILSGDKTTVSLIDYGFSIVPGLPDLASLVDVAVGTPMFMAPEQTYPKAAVDHRADIYSLGLILYNFLTGWYPYAIISNRDEKEEYFMVHRSSIAVPMSNRNPDIPKPLSDAVARALEKDPRKRFQSAEDFADALGNSIADVRIFF